MPLRGATRSAGTPAFCRSVCASIRKPGFRWRATCGNPKPGRAPPFSFLGLARAAFVEEGVYRGGGGLLQPLLAPAMARNPLPEGLDERLIEFLGAAEEDLHARGLVDDAFAIFVGRRRAAPG